MRMLYVTLTAAAIACAVPAMAQTPAVPELRVGDPAPAFALAGSDGETYTLSDYIGKKPVVLAWFPKAFTAG